MSVIKGKTAAQCRDAATLPGDDNRCSKSPASETSTAFAPNIVTCKSTLVHVESREHVVLFSMKNGAW